MLRIAQKSKETPYFRGTMHPYFLIIRVENGGKIKTIISEAFAGQTKHGKHAYSVGDSIPVVLVMVHCSALGGCLWKKESFYSGAFNIKSYASENFKNFKN